MKDYDWTQEKMAEFFRHMIEARGEFGRLVLLLAEVDRVGEKGTFRWFNQEDLRRQMRDQLQRCLDTFKDRN